MRVSSSGLCILALGATLSGGMAQEKSAKEKPASAFDAVRLLNPQQQAALAIIAGREGALRPERWHLLLHEPESETGLREVVVTKGKITASRTISQFSEKLSVENVFAPESLKLDSDKVVRTARDYARANHVMIAKMHFDLRRSGPEGAAHWTAICQNERGEELGRLVINASDSGTVISHAGFALAPMPEQATTAAASVAERRARSKPLSEKTARRRTAAPPFAAAPQPGQQPPPRAGFFDRVFGSPR